MEELTTHLLPTIESQYVTFTVGSLAFGIDIGSVREIIRQQPLTEVPLSPKAVRGLINLRGQVLTAIDMRAVLALEELPADARPTNIVVKAEDELISLLVDSIGDVISVDSSLLEDVPPTLEPDLGRLLHRVIKLDGALLLALNPSSFLALQES
jgi:purine-binding chemotaxis protein CheW